MSVASTGFVAVEQMREAASTLLDDLARNLGPGRDVATEVRVGRAFEVIAAVAEHERAELAAVGSRGLSSAAALVLGSVSRRLASHGPCPTIVVPLAAETLGDGPLLCAVDDSDHARAALATAAALAERLHARLVTVHADRADAPEAHGRELLARLIVEAGLGTRAERVLVHGEPADAIVAAADAYGAAMIVIGSRGRGALASSLLGGVSSAVASRSASPVTVVRVGAAPDDG